jgi:hypothetical protein
MSEFSDPILQQKKHKGAYVDMVSGEIAMRIVNLIIDLHGNMIIRRR